MQIVPEGPSTKHLRTLVPTTNKGIWILEPETSKIGYLDPLGVGAELDLAA